MTNLGVLGFDCKLRVSKRTKKITPKVINLFGAPLRMTA